MLAEFRKRYLEVRAIVSKERSNFFLPPHSIDIRFEDVQCTET